MQFLEIGIFAALLALGYFVGRLIERRHYASIRARERELQHVLAFAMRFPPDRVTAQRAFLAHGTVVVSADFFKTFVAGLRNLFGGRLRAYETLIERARREALLRLKQDALSRGSRLVVCVRFQTTTISSGFAPAIEVLAYGTALVPHTEPWAEPVPAAGAARPLGAELARSARGAPA